MKVTLTILTSLLLAAVIFAQGPADELKNVVTIAGTGPYIGDGGPATSAGLNLVEGVAVDAAGNLWIVDTGNNRIRKVDAATPRNITTVVGTGVVGFAGDNGPATQARLNSPSDLAFDAAGNLYFTDAGNHRVRKVATTGIITTVAGSNAGFSDGAASTAKFNNPRGVAVVTEPSGPAIYTADLRNNRVRRIDGTSGAVTTVAGGNVTPPLNMPWGVALDTAGYLYIGEAGGNRVLKVSPTKVVTTVVGTGTPGSSPDGTLATVAAINSPRDIAVDNASGNLYFVENMNNRVRFVNSANGTITTVAGTGQAGFSGDGGSGPQAQISGPFFIALDASGNVYIGDRGNSRVRKADRTTPAQVITTVAGGFAPPSLDPGQAINAYMGNPAGLAFDASGNLYVAENFGNRIRKVDVGTGTITTVAGSQTGQFGSSGDNGAATSALLSSPHGLAFDASGNLYTADSSNRKVRKVSASGIITTVAGTVPAGCPTTQPPEPPLNTFRGVAIDRSGNLWIADTNNHRVRFVNLSSARVSVTGRDVDPGCILTIAGTGANGSSGDGRPAAAAQVGLPIGLAFDAAGNLTITSLQRVRFINLTNAPFNITTVAGSDALGEYSGDGGPAAAARLFVPQGLSFDPAGNLYIADTNNHRIRRIDTSGTITTVAGTGVPGFTGDGGAATAAPILFPRFVASDASGDIYFSEFGGNRVRRLNVAAKELSVFRSSGNLLARVEVHNGRQAPDLSGTTLSAIDSTGQLVSSAFPGTTLGPDPADPANPRKRVFDFGQPGALLTGQAFRVDSRFSSDGKRFSGDALYSIFGGLARAWIGLKNADDQGTRFDLRVEVYKNSGLVTSGLTRCITGVTRNPDNALEALIAFDMFSTPYQSGDVASFRVLTRIGTQPDNTMCGGHSSALGLRMYYDGAQRPSRFVASFPPGPLKDFYLHTLASSNFLNDVAPTATAPVFVDSPSINFFGGNAWKEVGAWSMTIP